MRIVFCGTPQFAVPTLKRLLAEPEFEVLAIFTQPDRPRGRGQQISFSPVKELALAAGVPVHQPEKIRDAQSQELLQSLAPDCIVIIAYGQIIPARLLPIPKSGWINLHASLLPKYRGAAPINWAIANGESVTGITSMRIDAGMDTGDMLLKSEIPIAPDEIAPQLIARLSEAGVPVMLDTLRGLIAASLTPQPQDHTQATSAPLLKKEDGLIIWARSAQQIYNRMRGFDPWPGAYTTFRGQACHLWGQPNPRQIQNNKAPGQIFFDSNNLLVVCGDGTVLRVLDVKQEGRKRITVSEFVNGTHLKSGEHFGS
ncbi:MAG TPA: methionyl-tRNA formyltransferase [Candidatus Eremiobacteraceae bacterium]|nr:methionyl-tRNA formyltransferase [Candidatus Eremiobacteraceae bacterium]